MNAIAYDSMAEPPEPIDDNELIARLRANDTRALETIFDTYFVPLVRFATSMVQSSAVAEDLVVDALFALWERRDRLRTDTTIRAYLYRAVRNRAQNEIRGQRRERNRVEWSLAGGELLGAAATAIPVDEMLEREERLKAVRRAISEFGEPRRTVVLLRWSRQMSFSEIAQVLGITEVSARAHVSRALATLRAVLPEAFE
jgi:RNA polymerase sigma-70 factor (ECF subfamily)